jgi:hypothetical protein
MRAAEIYREETPEVAAQNRRKKDDEVELPKGLPLDGAAEPDQP